MYFRIKKLSEGKGEVVEEEERTGGTRKGGDWDEKEEWQKWEEKEEEK